MWISFGCGRTGRFPGDVVIADADDAERPRPRELAVRQLLLRHAH